MFWFSERPRSQTAGGAGELVRSQPRAHSGGIRTQNQGEHRLCFLSLKSRFIFTQSSTCFFFFLFFCILLNGEGWALFYERTEQRSEERKVHRRTKERNRTPVTVTLVREQKLNRKADTLGGCSLSCSQHTVGLLGINPWSDSKNNFNIRKWPRNQTHSRNVRRFSLCANLDSLSAFISSAASS